MHRPLRLKTKRIMYNIARNFSSSRKHKRLINKFAEKYSLVNFGSVNRLSDEGDIIRGFTSSTSHQDNHYCVGTVDGYDIKLVDRSDVVCKQNGLIEVYNWLIFTVDLQNQYDIPHFFIKAKSGVTKSYDSFFLIYPNMNEIDMGTFENYGTEFTSRFSVYSPSTKSIEVERLLPASVARVFSAHFWPLSVEYLDGVIYLYTDSKHITTNHLETMLKDIIWLARHLDRQVELLY